MTLCNRAILISALLLLLLLLLPLLALPIVAQEAVAQEQGASSFAEVVDVRVVNLEVVVEDEDGRRVRDLQPDDFTLYVADQPVSIEFFTEVWSGLAVPPVGLEQLPVPALESEFGFVGTNYLLFLDEISADPWTVDRVLRSLQKHLEKLGPHDRLAIVSYTGGTLERLSDWQNSPERLGDVLKRVRDRRQARRPRFEDPNYFNQGLINPSRRPGDDPDEYQDRQVFNNGVDRTVRIQRRTLYLERSRRAAESAMRSFAEVPGRKVMLLVTANWPFSPAEHVLAADGPFVALERLAGGMDFWEPLFQCANRTGFTLYPVEAGGSEIEFSFGDPFGEGPHNWTQVLRDSNDHGTLQLLADETGGRVFLENQAKRALEEVIEDTRSYYWLGFTPSWQQDDTYRNIRVEANRPGLRVRHRGGFHDLSRSAEVGFLTEGALLTGKIPGALPLQVEFGAAERAGNNRVEVPLRLTIPADSLYFLAQDERYIANLELRLEVQDQRGQRAELSAVPVVLEFDQAPRPGEEVVYETTLRLRNENHFVVVVLFDPLGSTLLASIKTVAI